MSRYAWDLSGTDGQCFSYKPGHQVHLIHFNQSMRESGAMIPVTAAVDDNGLVHIEGDNLILELWNHHPAMVCAALQRFGGIAVWKAEWHLLAVPTEAFLGSARSVFNLAAPREKADCYFPSSNLDHAVPNVPSPTIVPPLRVAARYAVRKGIRP
jgi:hypothetical protein